MSEAQIEANILNIKEGVYQRQEDQILDLIEHVGKMTAWGINNCFPKMLRSSIVRALNTLHNEGKIEIVDKVDGRMGRPESVYAVVKEEKVKDPGQRDLFDTPKTWEGLPF